MSRKQPAQTPLQRRIEATMPDEKEHREQMRRLTDAELDRKIERAAGYTGKWVEGVVGGLLVASLFAVSAMGVVLFGFLLGIGIELAGRVL